jgi:uncharacterized membrane protein YgaE (UPF0421/DUF939 family)
MHTVNTTLFLYTVMFLSSIVGIGIGVWTAIYMMMPEKQNHKAHKECENQPAKEPHEDEQVLNKRLRDDKAVSMKEFDSAVTGESESNSIAESQNKEDMAYNILKRLKESLAAANTGNLESKTEYKD